MSRIKYYSVSCAKGFEQPKMGDTPRAAILPTTDAAARRTRWMGHACAFACGALACAAVRPAGGLRGVGPTVREPRCNQSLRDTVDGPLRRLRGVGGVARRVDSPRGRGVRGGAVHWRGRQSVLGVAANRRGRRRQDHCAPLRRLRVSK